MIANHAMGGKSFKLGNIYMIIKLNYQTDK